MNQKHGSNVRAGAGHGFRDRGDAGRRLAEALEPLRDSDPFVLALPRGGVPVGFEIAQALGAPFDVWLVRKVGVPWHPELGLGAVAEGGFVHLNRMVLDHVGLSRDHLEHAIEEKQNEVEERVHLFRGHRPPPDLRGRTVILVDDGVATGGTVRAAVQSIREHAPASVVLAVPVAAPDALEALTPEVDEIVCLHTPPALYALGVWYVDFSPVSDDRVVQLLGRARTPRQAPPDADPAG